MACNKSTLSESETLKLIKEVKKRGCIWNLDDDNYSERFHLTMAWDDIARTMDMPEDVLRVKWKNLRDFFKKEVRKNDVKDIDDYGGRWRYFKTLGFLLRPEKDGDEDESDAQTDSEKDEPEINFEPKYEPDSNLEVYLEEDPIPEKRFKTDDTIQFKYNTNDDENDYDMMFLKSLTPFLSQLEPTRNLVVRSRMQDMLLNEIAAQNMSNNRNMKS